MRKATPIKKSNLKKTRGVIFFFILFQPENVLCVDGMPEGYEELKLIDFGTARLLTEETVTVPMCGAPEFVGE